MARTIARDLEAIDGDLVREFLHGQGLAFDVLYRRFFPRLVRLCRRRMSDSVHAEDIAQETLIRAFEHIDEFDRDRPMWPWLKTIATRLVIDHARARDRETVADPGGGAAPDTLDFANREDRLVLLQALERVPRRQRVALTLRYLDEWNPSEVADFLGVSRPAIEQLLFRARRTLRAQYRRMSGGVVAVILVPVGWLRRASRSVWSGTRTGSAGLADGVASVTAMQLASGLVALVVGLSGPLGAGAGARLAREAPLLSAAAPGGAEAGVGAEPAPAGGGAITPPDTAGGTVLGDVTDPNADVHQPEDARIETIVPSPNFERDGVVFAAGRVHCRLQPCPPVLFRSADGGASWTRLAARGFVGSSLLLPPSYGRGDDRMFAMGPEGLEVSGDGGSSFVPAVVAGAPYAIGSAAISPAFNMGDPTILIGAQTLLRYRDAEGIVEPAPYTALPGPLEPAFSPAYPVDPRIVLGALEMDRASGTFVSTVFTCSTAVCESTTLPGQRDVPQVRLDDHFARTGRAYAFTLGGIFVSDDGARTFTRLPTPWPATEAIRDLAVVGDQLFAATTDLHALRGGLYRSSDGGATWVKVRWAGLGRGAGTLQAYGDRILVGLRQRGLACSTDGGVIWSSRCPPHSAG
ncbi:MAG: sigma-70 family RNA polymerase sigma factor [Actinomycetota bacterium]